MTRRGKAVAFQFYAQDWLTDLKVRSLTPEARGIYLDLLCYSWIEGGLPADLRLISRILAADLRVIKRVWLQQGLDQFWPKSDDGLLRNPKLEEIRKANDKHREGRKRAGKAGAAARWQTQCDRNATAMLGDTSPSPSPSPSPEKSKNKKNNPPTPQGDARKKRAVSGPHQEVVDHWVKGWEEHRLGAKWKLAPKDLAALKKLRTLADGDVEEVKTRMNRMMADEDAWVAANASPSLLVSKWNNYAVVIKKRTRPQTALDRALLEIENGTP